MPGDKISTCVLLQAHCLIGLSVMNCSDRQRLHCCNTPPNTASKMMLADHNRWTITAPHQRRGQCNICSCTFMSTRNLLLINK